MAAFEMPQFLIDDLRTTLAIPHTFAPPPEIPAMQQGQFPVTQQVSPDWPGTATSSTITYDRALPPTTLSEFLKKYQTYILIGAVALFIVAVARPGSKRR